MNRPSRDETLMEVAHVMAKRGSCSRLQVGAVFAHEGRILVSGYNGAPHGSPHCIHKSYTWPDRWVDEPFGWEVDPEETIPDWMHSVVNNTSQPRPGTVFHYDGKTVRSATRGNGEPVDPGCVIAEHAERNAIYWAASQGIKLGGSDLFVTHQPCYDCARALVSLNVKRVLFASPYRKPEGLNLLIKEGIEVVDFSKAAEV